MTPLIRARIDGAALAANLARVRQIAPRSKVMAVIKANAYGHGLLIAARALRDADALAVARLEEALPLRRAGIRQQIVLLEGVNDAEHLDEAGAQQLDLVVHDPSHLPLLAGYRGDHRFHLWIKVDTGMNRLGFRPEQYAGVLQQLRALQPASLRLMTHLAGADDPEGEEVGQQMARFQPLLAGNTLEVSIANSAALLSAPALHADWVRPGLALYGVSPFAHRNGADLGLEPAMTLETTVIAVREVPAGECVGYGGAWQAARDSRIAILAAGYADGLLRGLPNGTPVALNGGRASLVGRVSMDMVAVDVTDLPPVQVGDRAQLWGAQLPVEELARTARTIPYELLCGISQRVPLDTD